MQTRSHRKMWAIFTRWLTRGWHGARIKGTSPKTMFLAPYKEARFPNLNWSEYEVTSDESLVYNCIAWAAGDSTQRWGPNTDDYWPQTAPREATLESFRAVFEGLGYQECPTRELEVGFEKVAIFVDDDGQPTHVARQLENGNWTSKLGTWEDIEHQKLDSLVGTASMYGTVELIMRRS